MRLSFFFVIFLCTAALVGCRKAPAGPEVAGDGDASAAFEASDKTDLVLQLEALDTLNSNAAGEPSPLLICVYELKSPQPFQDILLDPKQVDRLKSCSSIGGSMIAVQAITLDPGTTEYLVVERKRALYNIGLVANYVGFRPATGARFFSLPNSGSRRGWESVYHDGFQEPLNTMTVEFGAKGIMKKVKRKQ